MPGKKTTTRIGKKFDDCRKAVRARGGAYDPDAVCAAQMNRSHPGALQRASAAARRKGARKNPRIKPGSVAAALQQKTADILNRNGVWNRSVRFRETRDGGIEVRGNAAFERALTVGRTAEIVQATLVMNARDARFSFALMRGGFKMMPAHLYTRQNPVDYGGPRNRVPKEVLTAIAYWFGMSMALSFDLAAGTPDGIDIVVHLNNSIYTGQPTGIDDDKLTQMHAAVASADYANSALLEKNSGYMAQAKRKATRSLRGIDFKIARANPSRGTPKMLELSRAEIDRHLAATRRRAIGITGAGYSRVETMRRLAQLRDEVIGLEALRASARKNPAGKPADINDARLARFMALHGDALVAWAGQQLSGTPVPPRSVVLYVYAPAWPGGEIKQQLVANELFLEAKTTKLPARQRAQLLGRARDELWAEIVLGKIVARVVLDASGVYRPPGLRRVKN